MTLLTDKQAQQWEAEAINRAQQKVQLAEVARAQAEALTAQCEVERLAAEAEAIQQAEEAKKPKIHPGPISKTWKWMLR